MPYPTRCVTLASLNKMPFRILWHHQKVVEFFALREIVQKMVENALDEMFHKAEARDDARDGAAAVLVALVPCEVPDEAPNIARYTQRKAWAANLDYLFPQWFEVQQAPFTRPA